MNRNRRNQIVGLGWGIGFRNEQGFVEIVETRQTRERARNAAKARTEQSNGLRTYHPYRLRAMAS